MATRYIRQSALRSFKTCRRQTMLDYFQDGTGYEKAPDPEAPASGGRDVGQLVHAGVEAYYSGRDPLSPIEAAREAFRSELWAVPGTMISPAWQDAFNLARIMVEGYVEWVAAEGADVGEETLGVEMPLEAEIGTFSGDLVILTGKLDRLVRDTVTGEYIIEDTKTVQAFDDLRWLRVADQLLTYNVLLRLQETPIKVNRARHNQIRKVKRTAAAKPPFYNRVEHPFNEVQVQNYWKGMIATIHDMVSCIQEIEANPENHHVFAPPTATRDCTWRCSFLELCPMMSDGSHWQSALSDLYVRRPERVA